MHSGIDWWYLDQDHRDNHGAALLIGASKVVVPHATAIRIDFAASNTGSSWNGVSWRGLWSFGRPPVPVRGHYWSFRRFQASGGFG